MAQYRNLSLDGILREMDECNRAFYSLPRILRRVASNFWHRRAPLISLVGNLSYRRNCRIDARAYEGFRRLAAGRAAG